MKTTEHFITLALCTWPLSDHENRRRCASMNDCLGEDWERESAGRDELFWFGHNIRHEEPTVSRPRDQDL